MKSASSIQNTIVFTAICWKSQPRSLGVAGAITHQEVERFLGMTAQLIQPIDNVLGIVTKSHSFLARYTHVPDGRDWRLDVLDSWPRLGRLVLLVLFFGVIIGTPAFFIARSLSSKATEVQFGSARVLLSQSTKEGQEFVLQVSAQGWENTGVPVPEGTRYEIDAWGRAAPTLRTSWPR